MRSPGKGAAGEHIRGHRAGHRHCARLRLHQRLPRHGERDGNIHRDRLSVQVAKTISGGLVNEAKITPVVVFAGLVGAILWNLLTWLLGLPSSSSHALFGGLIGASLVVGGSGAVNLEAFSSRSSCRR